MRSKRVTNNESSGQTWENLSLTWALISFLLKGQGDLGGGDLYSSAAVFLDYSQGPIGMGNRGQ